ncbi:MAG: hypothetical protein WC757_04930 [Candidatus Paceibacterota bacterium]
MTYLEGNQPIATLLTGVLAIAAVIISQVWFDFRQRAEHQHGYNLKAKEIALKKKEETVELLGEQVRAISLVEDIFDSWWRDFQKNYSHFKINNLLREIDTRSQKIQLMVDLYFAGFESAIEKIVEVDEVFLETCADFAMAGSFGEEDFTKLDHMEIVEICNAYAVQYLHLTHLLIARKETGNPIINKL